ncbi:MAG: phosphatase PAP2 family protein [Bacillota bacterium]
MESPPVTRPYFSPTRGREKGWLLLCWAVTLVCTVVLWLFWAQTRGMDFILYLQQFRGIAPVEYFFQFFTFLGNDEFYMLFFGVLIWCVSKPLGFWTAAVLLVSGVFSGSIKDLTVLERPYLEGMEQLDSHAFPSGHTLTAVTVWGYMAVRIKKTGFWVWAVAAMALIGFSRIILGYHFPGDVLGGFAIGIPLLLLLVWVSAVFVEKGWPEKFSLPVIIALCIVIPVLAAALLPVSDIGKLMGLFAGAAIGYVIEKEKVRMVTQSRWYLQIVKALIGAAVLFGIIMGLSKFLPSVVVFLGFIRYALGGIWVTLIAPLLFTALKLSPREPT